MRDYCDFECVVIKLIACCLFANVLYCLLVGVMRLLCLDFVTVLTILFVGFGCVQVFRWVGTYLSDLCGV